jgi:hypothetical protein
MIAKGARHAIHSDRDLDEYTEALLELTALENPSRSETNAIGLLTLLIERYEETHYPIPAADAVSTIKTGFECKCPAFIPTLTFVSSARQIAPTTKSRTTPSS